jgi:hypothetical protein
MTLDPQSLQIQNLFYAMLTVFVTVVLVTLVRVFGKLPVSLVGPDLNLLTYGFLWDTGAKALRGVTYWPQFKPLIFEINKPTTLFVLALLNLLLLGANLKFAHLVENTPKSARRTWLYSPLVNALGVFSLILFLWIQAMWEKG